MNRPDRSKWTEILSYGAILKADAGSIEDGTGSQFVVGGAVQPFFTYTVDGVPKAILASAVHGWGPHETIEQAARPASMQEFAEPLRVTGPDGREEPNPFANFANQGQRDLSPAGLNRP